MLENCSELKKPCIRLMQTMAASGVLGPTCPNSAIVMPMHRVLATSTWR